MLYRKLQLLTNEPSGCVSVPLIIESLAIFTDILCICFILVRVVVYPEPIPGTLGVRRKYTLDEMDEMPVHEHTHIHTLAEPIHLPGCF